MCMAGCVQRLLLRMFCARPGFDSTPSRSNNALPADVDHASFGERWMVGGTAPPCSGITRIRWQCNLIRFPTRYGHTSAHLAGGASSSCFRNRGKILQRIPYGRTQLTRIKFSLQTSEVSMATCADKGLPLGSSSCTQMVPWLAIGASASLNSYPPGP